MLGDGYLIRCPHAPFRCDACRSAAMRSTVAIAKRLWWISEGGEAIARLLIEHVTGIPVMDQLDVEAARRLKQGASTNADRGGLWRAT